MRIEPKLSSFESDGLHILWDERAYEAGLLVGFTDRRGGASEAPYDTLNLAARVGDDAEPVQENRKRVALALGFDADSLALCRQVHGTNTIEVHPGDQGVIGSADGLVARAGGPTIGILTADCAPVIVSGENGVAVLHAGWRGLVAGVIEAGLARLGGPEAAWVGPSIRSCCYEVGSEVVDAFRARGLPVAAPGRVDTADAARAALMDAGVSRVAVVDACTHCNPDYFSYRRDGVTGRQGAFSALFE